MTVVCAIQTFIKIYDREKYRESIHKHKTPNKEKGLSSINPEKVKKPHPRLTHYAPRVAQRREETANLLSRQGDSFLSVHNKSDAQRAVD